VNTLPKFSRTSTRRLVTCDKRLERLALEVVRLYDCTVICGHRNKPEQEEAYRMGFSKKKWPESKHNKLPSLAIDLAPYPVEWNNTKRMYHFAGFVQAMAIKLDIPLRWGGDWDSDFDLDDQTFMDLVHFEIRGK
jgi:hypothetical protein